MPITETPRVASCAHTALPIAPSPTTTTSARSETVMPLDGTRVAGDAIVEADGGAPVGTHAGGSLHPADSTNGDQATYVVVASPSADRGECERWAGALPYVAMLPPWFPRGMRPHTSRHLSLAGSGVSSRMAIRERRRRADTSISSKS